MAEYKGPPTAWNPDPAPHAARQAAAGGYLVVGTGEAKELGGFPFSVPTDRLTDDTAAAPKAKTYDEGKEPLARLPWAAIDSMSKVQAYGHTKYGDFDNYRKGLEVYRNLSCALRHLRDFLNGVDVDHESGLDVLGHAMCRIAFVIQNRADGVAIDDRYSKRVK